MLDWPNRTAPLILPFAVAGLGIAHFENNAPVARRWLARMCLSFVFPLGRIRNNNTNRGLLFAPIIIGMSMAR
jgi:hypothetical protein